MRVSTAITLLLLHGLVPAQPLRSRNDIGDDFDNDAYPTEVQSHRFLKQAKVVGNDGVGKDGSLGVFPLQECQGDCDNDDECDTGLVCFERNDGEAIPGCTGKVNKRADFCIKDPNETGTDGDDGDDNNDEGGGDNGTGGGGGGDDNGDDINNADVFRLKLYWEDGYYWQEEKIHRRYCLRCKGACENNKNMELHTCDTAQMWTLVEHGSNNVQIKARGTNLCMTTNVETVRVRLAVCNVNNINQRFKAVKGTFTSYRFQISPRTKEGWCLTNRHHPWNGETLRNEPCQLAEKSDTSYWNKY